MRLFDVEITQLDGGLRAALSGEIDLSTVAAVQERLDAALDGGVALLVVDLREVTFLDSSGLRLILQLDQRQRTAGARLALVHGPRRVRRVFELTSTDSRLDFVDDPSQLDTA